jgi:hypothetical protein
MRCWIPFPILSVLLLAICVTRGNPIPGPLGAHYYISFEQLQVAVSPTNAVFKGTFEFSSPDLKDSDKETWETYMELPIWFPQQTSDDPSVNAFWEAFGTNIFNVIRPNNKGAFEKAVALKVFFGRQAMPVAGFAMLYQDGDRRPFEFFTFNEWKVFQEYQEPGFCCLLFHIDGLGTFAQKHVPVTISYRQPLLKVGKTGRFFYLPIFENLPKDVSTTDTNRYSIELTALPGCLLSVTNGSKAFQIEAGNSVTLIPEDRQAIRAIVATSN